MFDSPCGRNIEGGLGPGGQVRDDEDGAGDHLKNLLAWNNLILVHSSSFLTLHLQPHLGRQMWLEKTSQAVAGLYAPAAHVGRALGAAWRSSRLPQAMRSPILLDEYFTGPPFLQFSTTSSLYLVLAEFFFFFTL